MRNPLRILLPLLAAAPLAAMTTSTPQTEPAFVGSDACRRCHLRQHRSWEKTVHAQVFSLLAPGEHAEEKARVNLAPDVDYRTNEFCLKCHTVGFGQPGGFVSVEETPELEGVGCESCHGPGSLYVEVKKDRGHTFADAIAAGLVYPVPETACRRCHGEETPFNPTVSPDYELHYDDASLGEEFTHEHRDLSNDHGPLPEGVHFQPKYGSKR